MSSGGFPAHPILIVDDDADVQKSLAFVLRQEGLDNLEACLDSREVEGRLASTAFEVILLDLNMPHLSGRDLLPKIIREHPETPVIVVTGVDDVATAVQCMRAGAFDYLVKPVDPETLTVSVRRAIEVSEMRRENALLKKQLLSATLSHPEAFREIVTNHRSMFALFQYVEAVAVTNQPVLITGETGVGKELIARALHKASGRKGAFVAVNIAGLDDTVFSDTLFGHLRGAYTGATEPRKGLIERAAGGTLFLDEIGDLSSMSQVKLLRLVQEREYFPLGSDVPKTTDARIVVATNRDVKALHEEGRLRDDLFFRLRAHHVHVPPLRERLEDLPLLVEHFLTKAASDLGVRKPTAPRELFTLLAAYHFPGNVRELESMVYNAVSTHKSGVLSLESFKSAMEGTPRGRPASALAVVGDPLSLDPKLPLPTLEEAEERLIEEALRRTGGNQTQAAQLLGITRQTLNRRLRMKRAPAKRPRSL